MYRGRYYDLKKYYPNGTGSAWLKDYASFELHIKSILLSYGLPPETKFKLKRLDNTLPWFKNNTTIRCSDPNEQRIIELVNEVRTLQGLLKQVHQYIA